MSIYNLFAACRIPNIVYNYVADTEVEEAVFPLLLSLQLSLYPPQQIYYNNVMLSESCHLGSLAKNRRHAVYNVTN